MVLFLVVYYRNLLRLRHSLLSADPPFDGDDLKKVEIAVGFSESLRHRFPIWSLPPQKASSTSSWFCFLCLTNIRLRSTSPVPTFTYRSEVGVSGGIWGAHTTRGGLCDKERSTRSLDSSTEGNEEEKSLSFPWLIRDK